MAEQIQDIMDSDASEDAKTMALDNMFDFVSRWVEGKINGPDGKPLPIMGDRDGLYELVTDIYTNGPQAAYVDPQDFDQPTLSAEAQAAKSRGEARRALLDDPSLGLREEYYSGDLDTGNDKITTEARGKLTRGLLAATQLPEHKGSVEDKVYNNAVEALADEKKAGGINQASQLISHGVAVKTDGWFPPNTALSERGAIELAAVSIAAAKHPGAVDDTFLAEQIEASTQTFESMRSAFQGANGSLESIAGADAVRISARSVQTLSVQNVTLVGSGGSGGGSPGGGVLGDAVEFLNVSYKSIKKGFQTGDWSDFGMNVAAFGASAVVSAGMVAGSILLATAVAGPVGAAVVGAAWALYEVYDVLSNGWELLNKIAADLGLRDAIEATGLTDVNDLHSNGVGKQILLNAVLGVLGAPTVPNLELLYKIDDQTTELPDKITGTDARELFYVYNGGIADGAAASTRRAAGSASTPSTAKATRPSRWSS